MPKLTLKIISELNEQSLFFYVELSMKILASCWLQLLCKMFSLKLLLKISHI